jgi:hypothetical protein
MLGRGSWAVALVFVIATLSLAAVPAHAKLGFTADVSEGVGTSDRTVRVTIRTPESIVVRPGSRLSAAEALGSSFELFSADDLDEFFRPRPGESGIPVQVVQIEGDTFVGDVVLPTDEQWALVRFPSRSVEEMPVRYETVLFEVPWSASAHRVVRSDRNDGGAFPVLIAIAGGAAGVGVALGGFRLADRRRNRTTGWRGAVVPD